MSNVSIWGFFRIIPSCQMWLHFKVVVVGWKKMESAAKATIFGCHWNDCVWGVVVVSGAGYAMAWGSEDFSFMGRGLRCYMTLSWESLEVFGVAIIVDIIFISSATRVTINAYIDITTLYSTSKSLPGHKPILHYFNNQNNY